MTSNRKRYNMAANANAKPSLPPIIVEDDGELPFLKQDFFSDVALIVSTTTESVPPGEPLSHGAKRSQPVVQGNRKLYTARCVLAYNSPVFERSLANAKKHEVEMPNKNYDDMVELLCYLDPRVPYKITAQTAKRLIPLSEEYEMRKLRQECENIIQQTFEKLRKDNNVGEIQAEINEEYLLLADRYGMTKLLHMCIEEYVSNPDVMAAKTATNSETLSEKVKLLILQKKLARLNYSLERERKYRSEMEMKANKLQPKSSWHNYWHKEEL